MPGEEKWNELLFLEFEEKLLEWESEEREVCGRVSKLLLRVIWGLGSDLVIRFTK